MKKTFSLLILIIMVYINTFSQNIFFSDIGYDYTFCFDSTKSKIIVDTVTFKFRFSYNNKEAIEDEFNYMSFMYGYITDSTETKIISHADLFFYKEELIIDCPEAYTWQYDSINDLFILKKNIVDLQLPVIHWAYFNIEYTKKYHHLGHEFEPIYLGRMKREELHKEVKQGKIYYR